MRVREDHVGDLLRLHAGAGHRLVRTDEVGHLEALEELRPVKAGVDDDVASPAANEPHHHGDIDLARLVSTLDETRHRKTRDGGVPDRVDVVLRRLGDGDGGDENERDAGDDAAHGGHCRTERWRLAARRRVTILYRGSLSGETPPSQPARRQRSFFISLLHRYLPLPYCLLLLDARAFDGERAMPWIDGVISN